MSIFSLHCLLLPSSSPPPPLLVMSLRAVYNTLQCEKLRGEAATLPGIRAELESLRRRHSAALELMGERDEEVCIATLVPWALEFEIVMGYTMILCRGILIICFSD